MLGIIVVTSVWPSAAAAASTATTFAMPSAPGVFPAAKWVVATPGLRRLRLSHARTRTLRLVWLSGVTHMSSLVNELLCIRRHSGSWARRWASASPVDDPLFEVLELVANVREAPSGLLTHRSNGSRLLAGSGSMALLDAQGHGNEAVLQLVETTAKQGQVC